MARNYRCSGEAEGVIMRIGGWKTRSVFERYNVVNEDDSAVPPSASSIRTGQRGKSP